MRSIAVVVILLSVLSAKSLAAEPTAVGKIAQPPLGYASPREAFDAKRNATAKRDWRTVFLSLTPASQDAAVFELCGGFLLWIELGGECGPFDRNGENGRKAAEAKLRIIMKKYGLESGKVWKVYATKYREKHGVDLKKLESQIEQHDRERFEKYRKKHPEVRDPAPGEAVYLPDEPGEEAGPSLPPVDQELLSKVVLPMVTDKAAFYEEMTEFMTPKIAKVKDPLDCAYDYGDLNGLTESEDTAKGWVAMTMYCITNGPGKTDVRKACAPSRVLRCFHKLNGRWYNDTEKGDFQPWDEKGDL